MSRTFSFRDCPEFGIKSVAGGNGKRDRFLFHRERERKREYKRLLCLRSRTIERRQATSSSSSFKGGRISDEKALFRRGFQLLSSRKREFRLQCRKERGRKSVAPKFTWLLTMWKEHIVTFLSSRSFFPSLLPLYHRSSSFFEASTDSPRCYVVRQPRADVLTILSTRGFFRDNPYFLLAWYTRRYRWKERKNARDCLTDLRLFFCFFFVLPDKIVCFLMQRFIRWNLILHVIDCGRLEFSLQRASLVIHIEFCPTKMCWFEQDVDFVWFIPCETDESLTNYDYKTRDIFGKKRAIFSRAYFVEKAYVWRENYETEWQSWSHLLARRYPDVNRANTKRVKVNRNNSFVPVIAFRVISPDALAG